MNLEKVSVRRAATHQLKNVILITLDCVRPEALSCYPICFSWRETFPAQVRTPNIDRIAKDGILFTQAFCQAPFTPASHASILTGLNPPSHGIRGFFGYRLSEDAETLAERLQGVGFHTCAIIGADALNSRYGLDRGFDVYDEHFEEKMRIWIQGQYRRIGQEATERALQWLDKRKEPFFLFVHYFDVHMIAPHILAERDKMARVLRKAGKIPLSRGPVRKAFRSLGILHSRWNRSGKPFHVRQVQRVDEEITHLVQALKNLDLYEQTLIVIMSDHGDAFGEHGEIGHRRYLYDTTLRVPLILKGLPEHKGRVVHFMVRSIDVAPTVYELLGLKAEASPGRKPLEGESLLPMIEANRTEDRVAYSETRLERSLENINDLQSHYIALRAPHWKLIVDLLTGERELYNLDDDPGEMENLILEFPEAAEQLYSKLMRIYADGDESSSASVDYTEEERHQIEQQLRDLGYI